MHTRLTKYFGLSPWMPIILVVIWKDIVIFTSCLIFRVLEKPRPPKEWLDGNACFWLTHCHDHQGHYQSPTLFTPVTIVWMLVFGWTSKLAVYTPIGFIVCPPDWGRWAGTPPRGTLLHPLNDTAKSCESEDIDWPAEYWFVGCKRILWGGGCKEHQQAETTNVVQCDQWDL